MYSVKEKKEHTEFALEAASQLLQYYNNFFEITYPLKKLGERARTHTHRQEFPNPHLGYFLPANLPCLTLAFVRFGGHPRLPGGSDGELGSHHLQRDQPAGGEELVPSGEASGCLRRSA